MQPIFQPVIPRTIGAKRVGIHSTFLSCTLEIAESKRLTITLLDIRTMDWCLSEDDWQPVREALFWRHKEREHTMPGILEDPPTD